MLERRRCHPLYILEKFVSVLVPAALYIVLGIFSGEIEDTEEMVIDAAAQRADNTLVFVGAIAIIGIFIFCIWLSWFNMWISAKDNTLILESGVFVKKRTTIPFSKINTIDTGRNIFQRIVGTCRLKIDTGALDVANGEKSEINLVFSLKEAEEFKRFILGRAAEDEAQIRSAGATVITEAAEDGNAVHANFMDFMLYGLTSSSLWKLMCIILTVVLFISEISSSILEKVGDTIAPYAGAVWKFIISSGIIMATIYFILLFILVTLVSNAISVATAAIRFYGFRVARNGDNIVIRYGLFTEKNYTLPAENIHAVVVRQNLLQQIIGRCSVEMISIGYGNEEKETNLLFPIIKTERLAWLLDQVLPEYTLSKATHKPGKRSVRFIIVRPIVWTATVLAAVVAAFGIIMDSLVISTIAAVIILACVIVASILKYRNNALGCDGKVVLVSNGGMHKTTHLIRVDAIQSAAASTGFFQRRHGVASYQIDFHAPLLRSAAVVTHLNDDLLPEIESYMMHWKNN